MEASPSGCHCLCQINHPHDPGVCEGHCDMRLNFSLLDDAGKGPRHIAVPMCTACVNASLSDEARAGRGRFE